MKARLYGEQHVAVLPWSEVWGDVGEQLTRHNDAERALVARIVELRGEHEAGELADEVYRAEVKAPTRAHPYIPHTGVLGHVARRVWSYADRFWDTTEGRVLPAPVRPHPHDHRHDSLVRQYLTGEPQFDPDAPLLATRHRRGASRESATHPAHTDTSPGGRPSGPDHAESSGHEEESARNVLKNLR